MKRFRHGLLLMALLGSAAPVSAQINGKIAYTTCEFNTTVGDRVCDIWSMNGDGTGQTNLTNTPDLNETQPAWSADGSRIAFMMGGLGGNRLMVMNADGTNPVALTPTPSLQFSPSWSPDGTRLAFVRQVPGSAISIQFDVLVINANGTGEVNLTNSDFDELEPAWSPDGTKIAFAGVRFEQRVDPITGDPETVAQWEIVTVNPDGSGEQIISAGDPGTDRARLLEEDRAPAWSPDSGTLVFMSQSVDPCCTPWQVWRVNRNGTGAIVMSDNPAVNDMWPSYSPDGTLIVFSSDRDSTSGQTDIYTMPAAGVVLQGAVAGVAGADAALAVMRLTTGGNANDPSWGREPGPPPEQLSLTVKLALLGRNAGGFVFSLPTGILCGTDCSQDYPRDTAVLLVALPVPGTRFAGWTGACSGTTFYCVLRMDNIKGTIAWFFRVR